MHKLSIQSRVSFRAAFAACPHTHLAAWTAPDHCGLDEAKATVLRLRHVSQCPTSIAIHSRIFSISGATVCSPRKFSWCVIVLNWSTDLSFSREYCRCHYDGFAGKRESRVQTLLNPRFKMGECVSVRLKNRCPKRRTSSLPDCDEEIDNGGLESSVLDLCSSPDAKGPTAAAG
jgi:hypothetical protein